MKSLAHASRSHQADGPLGHRSYGYDAAYNRTSTGGSTLTYNAANQLIWTGYAYDHHGNPTTRGGYALSFDAESRLKQYGTFSAEYNGDGLRTRKQVGTTKTFYLYDGTDLVAEYNGSGTLTATNTFGANGLLSRSSNGQRQFYEFDPMGNVVRAEDVGSNTLGSWSYDAYGNRTGSAPIGPYLYGGQWGYYTDWNTNTGLILCTHRYYDPNLGRWLTRDPIGHAGGINLYGYVEGNPVNWVDPTGLAKEIPPTIGFLISVPDPIAYANAVEQCHQRSQTTNLSFLPNMNDVWDEVFGFVTGTVSGPVSPINMIKCIMEEMLRGHTFCISMTVSNPMYEFWSQAGQFFDPRGRAGRIFVHHR